MSVMFVEYSDNFIFFPTFAFQKKKKKVVLTIFFLIGVVCSFNKVGRVSDRCGKSIIIIVCFWKPLFN